MKKIIDNYLILLFIGIFLYIIGIIISVIYNSYNEYNPLGDQIIDSPIVSIIFICILAPFYEELAFRFWGIKKQRTKIILGIVSVIIIYLSIGIYLALIAILLYVFALYFLKNNLQLRNYILAVGTSVIFAAVHFNNFGYNDYLFALPNYMGISLILSYIVIRFNIYYSMIFHSLFNILILVFGGFFFSYGDDKTFETRSFFAKLETVSAFNKVTHYYSPDDKIVEFQRENLSRIGYKLIENKWQYNISTYPTSYKFYSLKTKLLNNVTEINKAELLRELVKNTSLCIDTIQERKTVYFLSVDENMKIRSNNKPEAMYILFQYCEYLSIKWDRVIMVESGFDPFKAIPTDAIKRLNTNKEIENEMLNLQVKYNLRFRKTDTIVSSIHIYEQKFK